MPRARQGQDRWQRPEWGAPDYPAPRRRRWPLPVGLLLVLGVAGWFWQHPEHWPAGLRQQWSDWRAASSTPADAAPGSSRLVYRWRDSAGVVQFTDRPPPEGVPYVPVYLDPKTNVLPPATSPWTDR